MVDFELRNTLGENLRQLIGDSIEVDQFDDACYFRFSATEDRGVREIAVLCHSLFSRKEISQSQEFPCIKSQAVRELISRAVLFLQSNLEYEWPSESLSPGRRVIVGLAVFLMLPVVMALVVLSMPLAIVTAQMFMSLFSIMSVGVLFVSLRMIARKPKPSPLRSKKMENRGDYEFWPFFRRGDYALVRRMARPL